MKLLTPGLVFADDADKFADALVANVPAGTEIAASFGGVPGRDVTLLADLHGDAAPSGARRHRMRRSAPTPSQNSC